MTKSKSNIIDKRGNVIRDRTSVGTINLDRSFNIRGIAANTLINKIKIQANFIKEFVIYDYYTVMIREDLKFFSAADHIKVDLIKETLKSDTGNKELLKDILSGNISIEVYTQQLFSKRPKLESDILLSNFKVQKDLKFDFKTFKFDNVN